MSRTIERNGDDCSQRIDEVMSQIPISRCRICFREIQGSDECQGSRYTCSGWSDLPVPSWTKWFRDDTDNRLGGCTYQWRAECKWSITGIAAASHDNDSRLRDLSYRAYGTLWLTCVQLFLLSFFLAIKPLWYVQWRQCINAFFFRCSVSDAIIQENLNFWQNYSLLKYVCANFLLKILLTNWLLCMNVYVWWLPVYLVKLIKLFCVIIIICLPCLPCLVNKDDYNAHVHRTL